MNSIPAFALLLAVSGTLHAQSAYPDKPVRLVVGFSAGGPTDLPGRFIADRLGTALGQRVLVENRTGAGGQIATQDVLSKPRDGYNLLLCTHFEGINAAIYKSVAYKLADIAPISQISRYYYGVALTNEVPAKDLDAFIAYARAHPGKLNYGTIGRGSAQEILALELGKAAGLRMTGVPYKGGADVMNDLIGGRVHLYVSPTLGVLPHHKAGKLRVLAVTSPERLAAAPEIPTLSEKGLPFVRFGWLGICAGSGTPQPIIALLNRHIGAAVQSAEYREMIEKAGSVPLASTPEELGRILLETYEQTAAIARDFGLRLD
jgi:tripartite-type tricarboxylate transporter receptor subunit TctC